MIGEMIQSTEHRVLLFATLLSRISFIVVTLLLVGDKLHLNYLFKDKQSTRKDSFENGRAENGHILQGTTFDVPR